MIDAGYAVCDAEVIEWDINVTFPEDITKFKEMLDYGKSIETI